MKEVAISEFKAKCLAMIEQVHKTKRPIRVTRFGRPVAEVVPPSPEAASGDWIGSMRDKMKSWETSFLRQPSQMTGRRCAIETLARYPHLAVELAGPE